MGEPHISGHLYYCENHQGRVFLFRGWEKMKSYSFFPTILRADKGASFWVEWKREGHGICLIRFLNKFSWLLTYWKKLIQLCCHHMSGIELSVQDIWWVVVNVFALIIFSLYCVQKWWKVRQVRPPENGAMPFCISFFHCVCVWR